MSIGYWTVLTSCFNCYLWINIVSLIKKRKYNFQNCFIKRIELVKNIQKTALIDTENLSLLCAYTHNMVNPIHVGLPPCPQLRNMEIWKYFLRKQFVAKRLVIISSFRNKVQKNTCVLWNLEYKQKTPSFQFDVGAEQNKQQGVVYRNTL